MKYKVVNQSNSLDFGQFKPILSSFLKYATNRMGFQKPPSLFFMSDEDNAQLPLGKTAHYDPSNMGVTVYTDGRHPKDILRSLSHELIHHKQNCDGQFDQMGEMGEGYAQNDKHLRSMEEEAYLEGNMCFRDWEDTHKKQLQESNYYSRGDKKMKLFEWKNAEMASLIREKFNIPEVKVEEEADKNTGMSGVGGDDEDETYMGHIKEDSGEEEGEDYDRSAEHDDDHIAAIGHHLDALEHDRDYDEEHVDETVSSREDPRNRKTGENTNLRPMEEDADSSKDSDKKKEPKNAPARATFGSKAKDRMKARAGRRGIGIRGVTTEDETLDEAKIRKAVREALKQFVKR